MSKLRKFARYPLPEELVTILRARFPTAHLDIDSFKVDAHECYNVGVKYNGPDAQDIIDCLQMLTATYGNVGFWFDGRL